MLIQILNSYLEMIKIIRRSKAFLKKQPTLPPEQVLYNMS